MFNGLCHGTNFWKCEAENLVSFSWLPQNLKVCHLSSCSPFKLLCWYTPNATSTYHDFAISAYLNHLYIPDKNPSFLPSPCHGPPGLSAQLADAVGRGDRYLGAKGKLPQFIMVYPLMLLNTLFSPWFYPYVLLKTLENPLMLSKATVNIGKYCPYYSLLCFLRFFINHQQPAIRAYQASLRGLDTLR